MRTENDKIDYREMLRNIESEYCVGEESNEDFWTQRYNTFSIEKRIENWTVFIDRYEHAVHGEFNRKSIKAEIELIVKVLKERDKDIRIVLSGLHDTLSERPLQNEDISDYMMELIKEYLKG